MKENIKSKILYSFSFSFSLHNTFSYGIDHCQLFRAKGRSAKFLLYLWPRLHLFGFLVLEAPRSKIRFSAA